MAELNAKLDAAEAERRRLEDVIAKPTTAGGTVAAEATCVGNHAADFNTRFNATGSHRPWL